MFKFNKNSVLAKRFRKLDCKVVENYFSNNTNNCKVLIAYQQLLNLKNDIEQQIYFLNKLYSKSISSQKQVFDNCCFDFAKLVGTKKQPKSLKSLLNRKYRTLIENISDFNTYEEIVKSNVEEFALAKQEFVKHKDIGNDFKEEVKKLSFTMFVPSVSFCKQDIIKKVNYINELYNSPNPQNEKGDLTYGN